MDHSFEIVDIHQHLGPYFNFHIARSDPAGLVEEMDRLGVRQGWISAHVAIEGDVAIGNADVAEAVRAYPGRFWGYVAVDPNYPEEVRPELEKRLAQPEFKMIKLHPALAGYPIDGPNYAPVWEMALARDCPVLTHAWSGDPNCGLGPIRRVLERYKGLKLIFGHALYPATFEEAAELARAFDNLILDITTSYHAYGMIEHAVKTVGADRIVYGSDMPFISAAGAVGKVLYAQISDDNKAKLLGGNARRLASEARQVYYSFFQKQFQRTETLHEDTPMYNHIADFVSEWQQESGRTARVLDALTDASLGQSVANDHRTLGRIAWHIVLTIGEMLSKTGLRTTSVAEDAPMPTTADEIVAAYRRSAAEAGRAVEQNWTDATLSVEDNMYGQKWPRGMTLAALINHEIHHRGQMTVLMRQAGLKVPGVYGPSRDEWTAFGMTPPAL